MKKKYEIGIKLHEFLVKLEEKERLRDFGFMFTYKTLDKEVQVSAGILNEVEDVGDILNIREWDVLNIYYLPKKYYDEFCKKVDIIDIIDEEY